MRLRSHQIDASDADAYQGLVKDPTTGLYLPADVVLGLTSTDSSVTIVDNGDGTLDVSVVGGGGGGARWEVLVSSDGSGDPLLTADGDWLYGEAS